MKTIPSQSLRTLGLGLGAVLLAQTAAQAQFDARVGALNVNQSIQDGTALMAAGKPTFVRAVAVLINPPSVPVDLDGIMRVYVNGVEASFSPVFSDNGPYPAAAGPNEDNEDDTLNFVFVPPVSNDVVVEVEINPPGPNFVAETNTANNSMASASMDFQLRGLPELVYSPIDYVQGGGLPDPTLIEPGVGDNMLQGIYPGRDWYYHRTDATSKLWTTSLNSSGNGLNNSLLADLNMMVPQPDFIYGWVIGGLPYNGVAIGIPGKAANGNTQTFKHQRTFAHEIGHLLGFPHNNGFLNVFGVDVEEAMQITEGLPRIKTSSLRDIMVPGLNTNQAWIRQSTYNGTFNNAAFNSPAPIVSGPGLFVTGIWDFESGSLVLDHVLQLPEVRPEAPVAEGDARFVVEAFTAGGQLLERVPVAVNYAADSCAGEEEGSGDTAAHPKDASVFFSLITGAEQIDRIVITPTSGTEASTVVLDRSANAPTVQFTSPGLDGDVSQGTVTVSWNGDDADGDDVSYYLRYSRDGYHYSPLATAIRETEWTVNVRELPAFEDGQGFFEVLASDGLNTTVARSPSLFGAGTLWAAGSNPPWVEIMTPDDGQSYQQGATVLLHSSGWDLEDRKLLDADIAWVSNLDGFITNGRMTSVANLSVGVHQITVIATDSDALTTTDTHTVTITARGLPDVGGGVVNYCTAGTSASGCQATLSSTGVSSATAPTGFVVTSSDVEGNKSGLFFFGTSGPQASPWGNGSSFQCVTPPTQRTAVLAPTGTSGACNGSFSLDLNAEWTAKPAKNPGSGAVVDLQFWYRDPNSTSNQTTSLSDAIEFTVAP